MIPKELKMNFYHLLKMDVSNMMDNNQQQLIYMRLPHPRKAAGAQITQSRFGEVVTINNNTGPTVLLLE